MNLKQKLDYHYKAFDKSQLEPDPLQFPHQFKDENDIEVMAFIASIFAYGNVKQIINTLQKFLTISDDKPFLFIQNFEHNKLSKGLLSEKSEIKLSHRFYTLKDVVRLFYLLNQVYNEFGSLKILFLSGYDKNDNSIKNAITNFSKYFLQNAKKEFSNLTRGLAFMFPFPEKGSACKRMNLFLRWMVRKDELDFGLWSEIPTSKLIIPVDTHVRRICKQLKLTKRKNVSWKMAEEITENLKKFDPDDPVKYDFAICHIGMRKMNF
jgi:uncharacterized protein (TIGR02757 family)